MNHNPSSGKDQPPVIKIGVEDSPLRQLGAEASKALALAAINQNQAEEFVGRGDRLLIKNGRKIRFLDFN